MDALTSVVVLVARLFILEPEGTRPVAEHRATIPSGVTGILRETMHEVNLPAAIALHLTPKPSAAKKPGQAEASSCFVSLRSELWANAASAAAGAAPDEVNTEALEIPAAGSVLVQIAEDAAGARRLMLSLRIAPPGEEARASALPAPPSSPIEVAFRVDAYSDRGGIRDLLATHVLRTLAGLPVSCHSSYRMPAVGAAAGADVPQEEVTLTLRPSRPADGWINVEAALSATIAPGSGGDPPASRGTETTRLVPLGIPFEISLSIPTAARPPLDSAQTRETYVVQVTPYLPSPPPRPDL